MQVLGSSYTAKPEEPFDGVLDLLNDLLSGFDSPPSPPSHGGGSTCSAKDIFSIGLTSSSRDCYNNLINNIEEMIKWSIELIEWSLNTIRNLIDTLIAALMSLPLLAIVAILYGIQLLLYMVYRQARWVLALNGFVYPEPDEVMETSFGRNLTTTYHSSVYGIINPNKIPITHVDPNIGSYPRLHSCLLNNLQCPNTESEKTITASAWFNRSENTNPNSFIVEEPFNDMVKENIKNYANAKNPKETWSYYGEETKIGNSTKFSTWMIINEDNEEVRDIVFCNWNLDADRGYAYKCWKSDTLSPEEVTNEEYIKRRRHTYE
jgi:hypothetical protein